MNEQHIEEIITALYDMIQDSRALPLGADKCILERDKVLDMLDEIIAALPAELKQSRTIVESRNELIGQARRESESIIRDAQAKAEELVSREAIYMEAKRQCQLMYTQTQERITELKKASNAYMDDALRRTEEAIAQSLSEVQDTRAKFRALTEVKSSESTAEAE
jgi:dsDNA-specific endonuclease/ATPase MutS2